MYIKQAFNVKHNWWLYIAGLAIIFIAVLLGQIPYTVILISKAVESGFRSSKFGPKPSHEFIRV